MQWVVYGSRGLTMYSTLITIAGVLFLTAFTTVFRVPGPPSNTSRATGTRTASVWTKGKQKTYVYLNFFCQVSYKCTVSAIKPKRRGKKKRKNRKKSQVTLSFHISLTRKLLKIVVPFLCILEFNQLHLKAI